MAGRTDYYLNPICSLRDAASKDRYLPVDSTEERFAEFTDIFGDPAAWAGKGWMFVVTGDRGYGKTSLIQLLAKWLEDQAASARHLVVPVDLSDERWPQTDSAETRMRRTLNRILSRLGNLISGDQRGYISGCDNTADAFHYLGEVLESLTDGNGFRVTLAVLLEGYPQPAEVENYYNITAGGMIFFAEMYDPEGIRAIAERRFDRWSAHFRVLQLDVLKVGDFRKFVDWIRGEGGGWPTVPQALVDEIDSRFIPSGIGMGGLAKMIWGGLSIAAEAGDTELTPMHLMLMQSHLLQGGVS